MLFMVIAHHYFTVGLDRAAFDAADGDSADIVVIVDGGNKHLQRAGLVSLRRGDMLQNGAEQHLQIFPFHIVRPVRSGACPAGTVENGAVQLLVAGV